MINQDGLDSGRAFQIQEGSTPCNQQKPVDICGAAFAPTTKPAFSFYTIVSIRVMIKPQKTK